MALGEEQSAYWKLYWTTAITQLRVESQHTYLWLWWSDSSRCFSLLLLLLLLLVLLRRVIYGRLCRLVIMELEGRLFSACARWSVRLRFGCGDINVRVCRYVSITFVVDIYRNYVSNNKNYENIKLITVNWPLMAAGGKPVGLGERGRRGKVSLATGFHFASYSSLYSPVWTRRPM